MDNKYLKTSVFLNDTVFNESTEQPIDVDFTLPDYCPDISKILKCRAVSRIASKGLNGRSITIDGSVCITVLYADPSGKLCSFEYQYPFSKSFELSEECPGGNLCCRTKCEYINCRAVTSRKIDVHGAAGIYCRVFRRKSTEIISDIDDKSVELKRGSAPATTPMGYSEKYLMIEEEIEIGQGQPPISSILRYDACTSVTESKIITDKIVVKGDMSLTALYCAENIQTPQLLKASIPFSQIVEMEGITDSCECETHAQLAFIELKPRAAATGEARSFILNAKLLITCEAYCNNDIEVVLDAFSRRYQANIVKNDISFEKINECISETFHCKKNLEFADGSISSISDLWCDIQSVNVKTEEERIVICGTIIAGIIACDENDFAVYYEKPIEFEYKYTMKSHAKSIHCDPQLEIISCGYTLTGASGMELRIDLSINAAIYERSTIPLIVDMTVDETQLISRKEKGAMTIYFASVGDSVWDIAQHYNAGVEEIIQINKLTEDTLEEGKMILIPMM